jgi:hypothetical protein
MKKIRAMIGFLAIACLALAQDVLTNDSVLKMVKAGLGEGLIVNMIQGQPGKYSLTPDDLVKLKEQGVPEKVMGAMIAKGSGASAAVGGSTTSSTAAVGDVPQNMDIGVYYKKGGEWKEMLPEVVNWKTGGVLKSMASAGVIKGDLNGHLEGPVSKNDAVTPVDVIIYAPEGVAITEYQLIHLRLEKAGREFRTVTGGVMHTSSGATRDVVAFEGSKIASRTFKISLPHLPAGEYGFLPPGAMGSSNGASMGKLYTFHVIE